MNSTLDNMEVDMLVAEKVMGLEPWPGAPGAFKAPIVLPGQQPRPSHPPSYSTDPAADYEVLVKVRETWQGLNRMWFNVKLKGILQQHSLEDPLLGREDTEDVPLWDEGQYRPGDYSHAALLALGVKL
jgi:hypothetical protein